MAGMCYKPRNRQCEATYIVIVSAIWSVNLHSWQAHVYELQAANLTLMVIHDRAINMSNFYLLRYPRNWMCRV